MNLDLSNQSHVEALRWACTALLGEQRLYGRMPTRVPAGFFAFTPASFSIVARPIIEALIDPNQGGLILGDALEHIGIDPVHEAGVCTGYWGETSRTLVVMIRPDQEVRVVNHVRLILALLDAPDRTAALAVLRGER